ncbi:MAG: serine/threonine protein kinase [Deltaproteobacteria bacterium]|nr:serine/threonine protein kinase [Deltaproteobacteria bacterium]
MVPDSDDPALDATQAAENATLATRSPVSTAASSSSRISLPGYELGNLLGHGGMGDIVLGHDRSIGRDVAIKQMRSGKPSADQVSRFLREAKIQARLEHPSIVPVHALGHDENGLPYFTMKRLTGTTLAEQLASKSPPLRQRMLRMFADVCLAVEFAHSRGVVHRDLKPANIMVGDFGEVYVLDWGLARIDGDRSEGGAIGGDVSSLDGETQDGALLGTPGFMAPEQIEGAHTAGPAADVYALGAILFEILSGEPLHPRGTGALTSTLRGVEEGPAARRPFRGVPPELDELCISALKTRTQDRPSAADLADRLQGYLDGDRDEEKRKQLAATFVLKAREALESGEVARRAEAMQAAGRALAIDPTSTEAAAIVQTIMFEPTKQLPPELAEVLTTSELSVQKRQGKVAMLSFLVVLAYLAVASINGVSNVPLVMGIAAYTVALASLVWRVTQRRAQPWHMIGIATANALLAALLSRTYGSLLIVPAVTCIMAVSLTSYPLLIDRKWIVISLLVASWISPVLLEWAGFVPSTFALEHDAVHLTSHVMTMDGNHTISVLLAANITTIVVIALFANALAASRRNALRQTEITAWHLKQLLPR